MPLPPETRSPHGRGEHIRATATRGVGTDARAIAVTASGRLALQLARRRGRGVALPAHVGALRAPLWLLFGCYDAGQPLGECLTLSYRQRAFPTRSNGCGAMRMRGLEPTEDGPRS
jgi:hypothetical protein